MASEATNYILRSHSFIECTGCLLWLLAVDLPSSNINMHVVSSYYSTMRLYLSPQCAALEMLRDVTNPLRGIAFLDPETHVLLLSSQCTPSRL